MTKIRLLSKDPILGAYFAAIIEKRGVFSFGERSEYADILVIDIDTIPLPKELPRGVRRITVSGVEGADLVRPFTDEAVLACLFPEKSSVTLTDDGRFSTLTGEIRLSQRETALLSLLLKAEGTPVSHVDLCSVAWPNAEPSENLLRVTMSHLRMKIEGLGVLLRPVRGKGYLLKIEANTP